MKPASPPVLRATRLLVQVRERIRYKHYSLRTEQAYVHRPVRGPVDFVGEQGDVRHAVSVPVASGGGPFRKGLLRE
jgi:hypothetical protein